MTDTHITDAVAPSDLDVYNVNLGNCTSTRIPTGQVHGLSFETSTTDNKSSKAKGNGWLDIWPTLNRKEGEKEKNEIKNDDETVIAAKGELLHRDSLNAVHLRKTFARIRTLKLEDEEIEIHSKNVPHQDFGPWFKLAPFVPNLLRKSFLVSSDESKDHIMSWDGCSAHTFPAALALVDISGFTALTESLHQGRGQAGIDQLINCIDSYFSQIIEVVLAYKGDIIKFAGDALIIAFPVSLSDLERIPCAGNRTDNETELEECLKISSLRAAACAKELAESIGVMKILKSGKLARLDEKREVEERARTRLINNKHAITDTPDERRHGGVQPVPDDPTSIDGVNMALTHASKDDGMKIETNAIAGLEYNAKNKHSEHQETLDNSQILRLQTAIYKHIFKTIGDEFHYPGRPFRPLDLTQEHLHQKSNEIEDQRECRKIPISVLKSAYNIMLGLENDSKPHDESNTSIHSLQDHFAKFSELSLELRSTELENYEFDHRFEDIFKWPFGNSDDGLFVNQQKRNSEVCSVGKPLAYANLKSRMDVQDIDEDEKMFLSLKMILSVGILCGYRVGGITEGTDESSGSSRWEFFVGDAVQESPISPEKSRTVQMSSRIGTLSDTGWKNRGPLAQAAAIEGLAIPGKVIVSDEVKILLDGEVEIANDRVLKNFKKPYDKKGCGVDSRSQDYELQLLDEENSLSLLSVGDILKAYEQLQSHLPFVLRSHIEMGSSDIVNEVRVCTILFVGFPSLVKLPVISSHAKLEGSLCQGICHIPSVIPEDVLNRIQLAVSVTQLRIEQAGGMFLQFRCDEKGFVALCGFGLPGHSPENSPDQAVTAALAIMKSLRSQEEDAVVGIATGNVLCAVVGSRQRADYTVHGDAINLAARLMVAAIRSKSSVICDENTQLMSKCTAVKFVPLEPLHLKGKSSPVKAFTCSNSVQHGHSFRTVSGIHKNMDHQDNIASKSSITSTEVDNLSRWSANPKFHSGERVPLIGREHEITAIEKRLNEFADSGKGGCIFIQGEPGSGKTRLLEEIQRSKFLGPLKEQLRIFSSAGKSIRRAEPMYPWRQIFQQAIAMDRILSCKRFNSINFQPESGLSESEMGFFHPTEFSNDQPTLWELQINAMFPDYALWRPSVATLLGVTDDEIPKAYSRDFMQKMTGNGLKARPGITGLGHAEFIQQLLGIRLCHSFKETKSQSSLENLRIDIQKEETSNEFDTKDQINCKAIRSISARSLDPGRPWKTKATNMAHDEHFVHKPTADLKEMSIFLRGTKIRAVLLSMLAEFGACYGKMVLMLDDIQLFDGPSLRLLLQATSYLPGYLLAICTMRPPPPVISKMQHHSEEVQTFQHEESEARTLEEFQEGQLANLLSSTSLGAKLENPNDLSFWRNFLACYHAIIKNARTECFSLRRLNPVESKYFICLSLGIDLVDCKGLRVLWAKSDGLPVYLHQMTVYLQLRARGQIQLFIDQNENFLKQVSLLSDDELNLFIEYKNIAKGTSIVGMEFVRATVNLHSLVPAWVDLLPSEVQYTLKIASIFGLSIPVDLLRLLHPKFQDAAVITSHLDILEGVGFLQRMDMNDENRCSWIKDGGGIWQFKDVIIRDIVYDMLRFGKKQELHAKLARLLQIQQSQGKRIRSYFIACHWRFSVLYCEETHWRNTLNAAYLFQCSAGEAIEEHAFHDAYVFIETAISMSLFVRAVEKTGDAKLNEPLDLFAAKLERFGASIALILGLRQLKANDVFFNRMEESITKCHNGMVLLGIPSAMDLHQQASWFQRRLKRFFMMKQIRKPIVKQMKKCQAHMEKCLCVTSESRVEKIRERVMKTIMLKSCRLPPTLKIKYRSSQHADDFDYSQQDEFSDCFISTVEFACIVIVLGSIVQLLYEFSGVSLDPDSMSYTLELTRLALQRLSTLDCEKNRDVEIDLIFINCALKDLIRALWIL